MTDYLSKVSIVQRAEHFLRIRLIGLSRVAKQRIMLFSDAIGFLGCIWLAAWVDAFTPAASTEGLILGAITLVVANLLARYLGFYHSIVRYLGMGLLLAGARVALGSSVAVAATAWLLGMTSHPFRLAVVYGAFCGLYLVGSRYAAQYFLIRRVAGRDKVIIYGAGDSGAQVQQAMQGNSSFVPFGFVDDSPA